MSVDDRALGELIEESEDLQSDAMQHARSTIPDLEDVREESRREAVDPDDIARFDENRKRVVKDLGLGAGGFARTGALAGGLGAALAALIAAPAVGGGKDKKLDVQILQTASSLEILAVATYEAALGLPFIMDGNEVVVTFAETTMMQHDEHRKAFQAQTKALGGKKQKQPNPKYAPVVEEAKPTLQTPLDVVNLAATLEQVATETYLADLSMFSNKKSKSIMASVMGVESQHLATLRAVRALLEGGGAALIAIPTDVAALPAAAGSVAFPEPFQGTGMASPPEEGAVK